MTDRVNAFTVVLDKDIRIEDAQAVSLAIQQLRGVLTVQSNIVSMQDFVAYERARSEIMDGILTLLGTRR